MSDLKIDNDRHEAENRVGLVYLQEVKGLRAEVAEMKK